MASIDKLKDKARKFLTGGKLAKAAAAYKQLVDLEPKSARWPHKLGEVEQRLGNISSAVAALERAALLQAEGGFLLKSIALCKQILAIDAQHQRTQSMLAELYAKKGGTRTYAAQPATAQGAAKARPAAPPPLARRPTGLGPAQPSPPPAPKAAKAPPVAARESEPPAEQAPEASRGAAIGAIALKRKLVEQASLMEPPREEPSPPPAEVVEIEADAGLEELHLSDLLEGSSTPPPVPKDDPSASGFFRVSLDQTGRHQAIPARAPQVTDLPETPLFSALEPAALRSLIERIDMREVESGDVIVREGTEGGGLFVLVEGKVAVYREGPPRQLLEELGEGSFFGEIALISKRARTATVEAIEPSTVLEISRDMVARLIEAYPAVLKVMLRFFRERLVDTLVETHRLFAPFCNDDRKLLAKRFDFVEVEPDTDLAYCGEPVDALYVVLSGRLMGENELGATFEVATGDVFGESSLLSGGPSPFSVTARTRAWLLRLDSATFREVIMTHPHVLEVVSTLADEELQQDGRVGAESMIVVL